MDSRHHDDAGPSRVQHHHPRIPRAPGPFAPFQSSFQSSTPLKLLELGRPLLPFSSPLGPFRQGRRDDSASAAGMGTGMGDNNNNSEDRLVETNSSLTPLDLDRPPLSRTSLLDCSESTSGITPCSWSSLFSAFRVPNINSFENEDNAKSNSTARNVPLGGHRLPRDEPQNSDEGNQRVPVVQNTIGDGGGGGGATGAGASSSKTRTLFQAQSSQFSSSWPCGEGNKALVLDGGGGAVGAGGGPVGSDQGSFTAHFSERPKLTSGQKNANCKEAGGSSPMVDSGNPILYAPIPSYAFPRAAMGDTRGKNKMVNLSTMNLEAERDGKPMFKSPPGMTRLPVVTGSPAAIMAVDVSKPVAMDIRASTSRPHVQLQQGLGLNGNNMGPMRGECNESGAKRCSTLKEVNTHDHAQPMVTCGTFGGPGVEPARGNIKNNSKVGRQSTAEAAERSGQKQSRHRHYSSAAVEEAGTTGFIKRSRQHPRHSSWTFQAEGSEQVPHDQTRVVEEANNMRTDRIQTCNWLQRWLPAGSSVLRANAVSTAAAAAARPKERQWNGPVSDGGHGRSDVGLSGMGPRPMEVIYKSSTDHNNMWNHDMTRFQNRVKDFSSRNGPLYKLSPFTTPSASALAMLGTASRRSLGPPLTQRKGSFLLRPSGSKKVKHVQFAE